MARSVFGDAIDYERVEIVRGKWWPFQPRGIVMAPTGNIHFHPKSASYRDDFAEAPLALQGLFIHEMTHVWQAQRSGRWFLPMARHPFCRYAYTPIAGRAFHRYGLEQQAEIVRHVFLARRGARIAHALDETVLPFAENRENRGVA